MIGKLLMNPYFIMAVVLFYLISVSTSYIKGRSHGYDSCKVEWDEANRKAQEEADATQAAIDKEVEIIEIEDVVVQEKIKTVYRDRIKEVIKYVQNTDTVACFDDNGVRLFNRISEGLPDTEAASQIDQFLSRGTTPVTRGYKQGDNAEPSGNR